jgi:hypothetical protein
LIPTADKFFNFTDVKPGDWGENTIDFTVIDNSAWMCANLNFTKHEALADYLSVIWWVDADGDNKIGTSEKILYDGPRTVTDWIALGGGSGNLPLTVADSILNWTTWPAPTPNILPVPGGVKQYLGVGWCFGKMKVTPGSGVGFSCDGSGDQNLAQGTSVMADLTFNIEQFRNNATFLCPEHKPVTAPLN